jgi:hypothetical protein
MRNKELDPNLRASLQAFLLLAGSFYAFGPLLREDKGKSISPDAFL